MRRSSEPGLPLCSSLLAFPPPDLSGEKGDKSGSGGLLLRSSLISGGPTLEGNGCLGSLSTGINRAPKEASVVEAGRVPTLAPRQPMRSGGPCIPPQWEGLSGGPAGWDEAGRSQSHFSSSPFPVDAQRLPLEFLLPTACTSAVLKREFLFSHCPRVCLFLCHEVPSQTQPHQSQNLSFFFY